MKSGNLNFLESSRPPQACNRTAVSHLSTANNIMSTILLSRLTPHPEEIIGDHKGGFQCNRSTTDHIFCIRQIIKKKQEYNETVHQLFTDFKNSYDLVMREVLYNILNEFGICIKE
jgi:hypothetical protein